MSFEVLIETAFYKHCIVNNYLSVQHQTGVDLKMPEKGSRKKRKKNSNLTNLKKEQDTPRTRLEKKVFKK